MYNMQTVMHALCRHVPKNGLQRGGKTEAPEPTWHSENLRLPLHAQDPTYLGKEERMK